MTTNTRQIDMILQSLDQLPTLSPVAVRLLKVTSSNDADFDEVIRLIEADPALSAKMLSLCRRADVGASRAITTVRRAAVMLGMDAVHSAVLSVQIYELMNQAPGAAEKREGGEKTLLESVAPAFDRMGFWKHSIAVACASELLANAKQDMGVKPDEAFVAGLVHDLGKLALDWVVPKTYDKIIRQADARQQPLGTVERAVLGLDHHQAGKRLAEHWSLPHMLQDAMWLHGQAPSAMPPVNAANLVGVVAVANGLCRRMMLGWSGGFDSSESLVDPWCVQLGLNADHLSVVATKLHDAVAERCRAMGVGEQTPQSLVVESIGAANRKLARMQDHVRVQARAAAGYAKALSIASEFAAAERPGGNVADVLARIGKGWMTLTGKPPVALVCQVRVASGGSASNEWRFLRFDASGQVAQSEMHEPPNSADGEPVDLRGISSAGSLGGAFEMAQWLSRRLNAEGVKMDGQNAPINVARLGMLPLNSAIGPTAVVVHEPHEPIAMSQQALATVTTIWSWAIGAAAQSEGSRRIAEQLAQTARELTETQSRLSEAESMARLGEFTSGAAHEMNNPLTVISGRAQLLADRLKSAKDKEDAQSVVRAAETLTELITQLHMVAKPPLPKRKPVEIAEWIESIATESRRRTGSAVPIQLDVRDDLLAATFDGSQIARAVTELLVNALQAAPKSRVIVRVERDRTPGIPANSVRIAVIDDGRGMTDHAKKHAFDPFFSDMPAGRRHGLGLPLARRILETQGGKISLETRLDRGTVAAVTFPTGAGEQQSSKAA